MINFLKYTKVYYIFSGVLILASLVCLIIFGLKPGIDFTGGSILEVEYKQERPSNKIIREKLADIDLGKIHVQPTGEEGVILRMKDINEDTHQEVLQKLRENNEVEEKRFQAIGPAIGSELKKTTKIVIIFSLLAIVLYIAFAFRRISRPVKSWQYGIAALLALFHDVLIPLGVFSVLGKIYGIQITIPVVVALLTVLGYSINDTVVVFDRIRENLWKITGISFEETVNKSLNQTLVRSINTSLTTLFVLVAIFFFGGETLKYFSLALIIGVFCGVYSSIFIASPLLVSWSKWRKRA
ncbi:MAG: protein translocase subunit SecF [Candidatus Pacebacteria bacterium]|nr:protein translocase subunit SecF [Candidatus Paceibacterota bacterium]